MAGIFFSVVTPVITLTGATAKTIAQVVAATNQRTNVSGFSVSFAGNSGTAVPVKVRLLKQTTAGTGGTGCAMTLVIAAGEVSAISPPLVMAPGLASEPSPFFAAG